MTDEAKSSLDYETFRAHTERYEQEKRDKEDATLWREHKAREAEGVAKRKTEPKVPEHEAEPAEHAFKVKA